MKKILKKIKYKIFFILYYKKNKLINERKAIQRQEMEQGIIKKKFNNDLSVKSGPFRGMKYINNSFGSSLLPKILGTYEYPLQNWVQEAIKKEYLNIIDIGSAEGYYSVGFAYVTRNSLIYAYDINEKALEANKETAVLNNVENKIVFKNLCTNSELNNIINNSSSTLIICDIEGAEKELLDPIKTPNLLSCDMIIESHDFFDKEITETLIDRFYQTHKIEIIIDYERDLKEALKYTENVDIANLFVNEYRPEKMKWLRLTRIN